MLTQLEIQFPITKRIKSFLWRGLMMAVAAFIAYAMDNLDLLELSPLMTTVIGLVLGEVSKWMNVRTR
jgi:hypothetical protein